MTEPAAAYWTVPSPVVDISDGNQPGNEIIVEIVTDTTSFVALENQWDKLVSASSATVFQTFTWQYFWWKHFGSRPDQHLFIALIRRGNDLIGIAPFFIQTYSMFHFKIFRRLLLLGSGLRSPQSPVLSLEKQGPLDYLDIISAQGFEKETAETVVTLLRNDNNLWDEIEFQNVPETGFIYKHVLPICKTCGFDIAMEHEDTCPIIFLPKTPDEFLSSMRRSVRRNLRYVKRGFLENTEYSVDDVSTKRSTDGAVQLLSRLHQKRWNAIGYPGLFSDPRFGLLIRDVTKTLSEKGTLWLKVLRYQGKAIAVNLCFMFNGTMHTYASGFDHDSATPGNSGAGSALVFLNILDSINSGCSVIDMGRGTESYKFQLTSDTRQNWRISVVTGERGVKGSGILLFRLCTLRDKIKSRLTCERTIAGILMKEKGPIPGLTGYARHITNRLASKNMAHSSASRDSSSGSAAASVDPRAKADGHELNKECDDVSDSSGKS